MVFPIRVFHFIVLIGMKSLGKNAMPSFARTMYLLLTRVVPLGLNGSDLEQTSDERDGRVPLELVDIWN